MTKKLLCPLLIVFLFITTLKTYAQATPVGVTTGNIPDFYNFSQLISYKGELYFAAIFNSDGYELLKVDNTTGLINIVKDISPTGDSFVSELYVSPTNDELYFSAEDNGIYTRELWKTDGTEDGTVQAADFNGNLDGFPYNLAELNNNILMGINGESGVELGVYDPINDLSSYIIINTDANGSSLPRFFTELNGKLYFSAIGDGVGRELHVTDGSVTGTQLVKDIFTIGTSNSNPENFTVFNNKIYFSADTGSSTNGNGIELWVTDGTTNGTYMVADINPGTNASSPENFKVFGNRLYFSATGSDGTELYRMEANESVILYGDINPGAGSSNPSNLAIYNGKLYFSANDGINGSELWSTDGSINGLSLVKDINTSPSLGSNISNLVVFDNKLYFTANNGVDGNELWATDGTDPGTTLVTDINTSGSSDPLGLTVVSNTLYFHANNGSVRRLWEYQDPTLSINSNDFDTNLKLHPNPTTHSFEIYNYRFINSVTIYDISGKKVKGYNGIFKSYDISELNAGTYFVEIKSNNKTEILKLIKK